MKRFDCVMGRVFVSEMEDSDTGDYVLYSDVEALQAKIKIAEARHSQAMTDWSEDAIRKTEVIVKLEKKLETAREALKEIKDKTESVAEFTRNALNIIARQALKEIDNE